MKQRTIAGRVDFYKSLSNLHKHLTDKYRKLLAGNSLLRLSAIVAAALSAYFLRHIPVAGVAVPGAMLLLFLFLLGRHSRLSRMRSRSETMRKMADDELRAFDFDFACFDGAGERIDPAHDFSFDLDLFGPKSLFQQINRTSLSVGKEALIEMVEHPMHDSRRIAQRQQAVKELTEKELFGIEFRATGRMADDTLLTKRESQNLFRGVAQLPGARFWKIAAVAVPAGHLLMLAFALAGMPASLLVGYYLLTLALSCVPMKQIGRMQRHFDDKTKVLDAYKRLFELTAQQSFESGELDEVRRCVTQPEAAAKAIAQLIAHCRNLSQSFAFPVLLLLNPLLMWNVRFAMKIEKWMRIDAGETGKWFSAIGKMDALISLATFAANRPDYTFPQFSDSFRFVGEQMGHPLIPPRQCVKNDIRIVSKPYFMIVTGANMAGKSTYLRTVGVNHLLASMGLPACASAMEFCPGRLLTNLRTADSLVNNESYFFAELKRLKMIIDRLKSGEDGLFVILDEILKGTNSEDKQKGSLALLKRLVKLGGNGIIATHDLALGTMEEELPGIVANFHFDADIRHGALSFDYKLRDGIAKNMNASFLMKSMGIVD